MRAVDHEHVFTGATLWGLELEPRFRVLAVTLELAPDFHPAGEVADRRVQLLVHPVSTILASLRGLMPDGTRRLHTFEDTQLLDVTAALGGATLRPPLFGRPEPRPGQWAPRFSLEGRSTAPDGTRQTLTVEVRTEDLDFDLFARYDDAELKDPDGADLV
ncbi:MAG TPA: hypothetical protein VK906_16695 [Egicoccus sp.]|nr:hypothetical protein [Egicoccus sp.]HSK24825.1 hypothetical protein [Egicoccus sp.]